MDFDVGLIGLGYMGKAIARRLLAEGQSLRLYNRTAAKMESLVQQGATTAATPRDLAASCDAVLTMVSDDQAFEAVTLGPDGAVEGLREGAVLIDMSTLSAEMVGRVADAVAERGAEMLHAPILGGPVNIYLGNATITVGGDEETLRRAIPLLEKISTPVIHVGPLTNGTRMKMALNITLAHLLAGIAGSLAFAGRAGLDQNQVLSILGRSSGVILERTGERMLSDESGVTFSVRNLEKDQRYFLAAAKKFGLELPTLAAAQKLFEKAIKAGLGEEDYTSLYRFISK